jgi:hypothetical protein
MPFLGVEAVVEELFSRALAGLVAWARPMASGAGVGPVVEAF